MGSPANECAFDNPYFKDDAGYLRNRQENLNANLTKQQQLLYDSYNNKSHNNQGLLTTTTGAAFGHSTATGEINYNPRLQPETNEQLDFIEHHISNLHNRQVTSSVKELTIFGNNSQVVCPPQQLIEGGAAQTSGVVDLTNDSQRARIIENPKEGDLVAVDITGHDFIGLGFDISGDSNEGIFIKSVLSRGPANESGCIEPGDKIKCLNISFDNITLQDAYDILNCGSPYKMRLLIEKQALPRMSKQFDKLRSTLVLRGGSSKGSLIKQNKLLTENKQQLTTKSYIKRLTRLVSPNAGGASDNQQQNNSNFGQESTTSELNNGHTFDTSAMYLGSAAARKHLSTQGYVINKSYNNDILVNESLENNHNDYTYNSNHSTKNAQQNHCNTSKQAQILSSSTTTTFNDCDEDDDDDDDYFRNVNIKKPTQNHIDLRMASSEEPVNINNKININRRQSSNDCVNLNKKHDHIKRIQDQHLEQTQSQPEIALNRLEDRMLAMNSSSKVNCNNSVINDESRIRSILTKEDNNNDKLINSMSTPIMNLLAHQVDQQQRFDLRRVSSRRKKKDSIKEEIGATSDTSFTDSTSKLVGDKKIQQSISMINKNTSTEIDDFSASHSNTRHGNDYGQDLANHNGTPDNKHHNRPKQDNNDDL